MEFVDIKLRKGRIPFNNDCLIFAFEEGPEFKASGPIVKIPTSISAALIVSFNASWMGLLLLLPCGEGLCNYVSGPSSSPFPSFCLATGNLDCFTWVC